MANGTEIRALELGEQIAQKQNVYIVDVTYKKADDTYSLCYYIDKEGGIGIDECELFSKAVLTRKILLKKIIRLKFRHRGQTENSQRNVNFFIISAERLT